MKFLLDTNACIRVLTGSSPRLVARLRDTPPSAVTLCSVTRAELLYGARRSARVDENLELLDRFFAPLVSLPFDDRAAEHYAAIRADLASRRDPLGPQDLQIAAIARAHDLTLITSDTRTFRRVVGLRVDNWG